LDDRRHREPARLLPERVPAHAVADDEQVAELGDALPGRILVDLLVRIASGICSFRDFEKRA
jgi:hypothetical protein